MLGAGERYPFMLTIVEAQFLDFPANRPDLGCAMLIASCRRAGTDTTLVKGQTRIFRDVFVDNSEELWHLATELTPSDVLTPQLTEFCNKVGKKESAEFCRDLRRLYNTVCLEKAPRTFLNARKLHEFWTVFKGATDLYIHYFKHLKQKKLSVIDNCVQKIVDTKPLAVGFSLPNQLDVLTQAVINGVRRALDVPIVAGGSVTPFLEPANYPRIFKKLNIDYLVVGMGDRALPELLDAIASGKVPRHVNNLVYKSDNGITANRMTALDKLDALPFPDFSQFDLDLYLSPKRILPVQSARGCSWRKCAFCSHSTIYRDRYETVSVDRFVEMIRYLRERYDCRHFTINDEEIPPKRMHKISRALLRENVSDCTFRLYARLTGGYDNPVLMDDLKAAGVASVSWGLESGSQKILDSMNKGISLETARRILQISSKRVIANLCFLIFGFPGETRDEAEKSIAFLNENAAYIDCVLSANYVISSGSPVDRRPEKWGVVKKENGKFSVNRGMQTDEAAKFRNDFRANCDFGHLMTNRDRFGNFAPGIFTARMLSFLLAAHERLDLPVIEQRMSGGCLDEIYPLMLGEIQWETQGPVLRRLDASRTMVINKVYWKKRRKLSRVEAACFEAAGGSISMAEVMEILCRDAENTESADSRRRTGLAFFREMFQSRQCLGFGKPW